MTAPNTIPRATFQQALQLLLGDLAGEDFHELHISPSGIITTHWEPGLPSVRQWVIVDECTSCHSAAGHPHTEYCRKPCDHGPCSHVYERECTDACSTYPDAIVCTWPGLKPEGQDCGQPDCPKHGGQV